MLDLLFGRQSRTYRRLQFLLPAVYAYSKLVKPYLRNRKDNLVKFLFGVFLIYRCVQNIPLLIGIDPPETQSGYSRDYFRAMWITQSMDAGFWTFAKIRIKWIRDILSVLATGYYLIAYDTAAAKCAKFRGQPTVNMLKLSWEKQKNFIFSAIIKAQLPKLGYTEVLKLQRDPEEWGYTESDPNTQNTITHFYYTGSKEEFKDQNDIIYFIPGGGWLATDPTSHEEYIYDLAKFTNLPIIALDYLKSPKYPFPYALEECLAFYKRFVLSNGASLGMNPTRTRRRVILLGDSAGGNLACGLTIKLIMEDFTVPHHLIMMYPCLNLDLKCWLEPQNIELLNTAELRRVNSFLDTNTGEHRRTKSFVNLTSEDVNGKSENVKRNKSFFDLSKKMVDDYQNRDDNREPSIWTEFGNRYDIEDEKNLRRLSRDIESPSRLSRDNPMSASISSMKKFDFEINESAPASVSYFRDASQYKASHIAMTSRICFFQDKILPAELMRALVLLYLKSSPVDPQISTNFVLSPLLAPDSILEHFPKVSILVGDRDPILDDSVLFAAKLRRAQKDHDVARLTVIPGW
eukprot:NODE_2_length_91304_cov_0.692462.p10 type:complete len:574 gc:universal NODE_2_length_91304_cov_0.692462:36997-38718(+)